MTAVLDRLREAIAVILRKEFAELEYFGVYEYSVQATDGNATTPSKTVDANPTATATSGGRKLNLPNVTKCPIMLPYGVTPPVGSLCTIEFLNGDPARPQVRSFNDPMTLMVFAGGTLPNARQGDMSASYQNALSITAIALGLQCTAPGSPPVLSTVSFPTGPLGPPSPAMKIALAAGASYGVISSGTPQVKS